MVCENTNVDGDNSNEETAGVERESPADMFRRKVVIPELCRNLFISVIYQVVSSIISVNAETYCYFICCCSFHS